MAWNRVDPSNQIMRGRILKGVNKSRFNVLSDPDSLHFYIFLPTKHPSYLRDMTRSFGNNKFTYSEVEDKEVEEFRQRVEQKNTAVAANPKEPLAVVASFVPRRFFLGSWDPSSIRRCRTRLEQEGIRCEDAPENVFKMGGFGFCAYVAQPKEQLLYDQARRLRCSVQDATKVNLDFMIWGTHEFVHKQPTPEDDLPNDEETIEMPTDAETSQEKAVVAVLPTPNSETPEPEEDPNAADATETTEPAHEEVTTSLVANGISLSEQIQLLEKQAVSYEEAETQLPELEERLIQLQEEIQEVQEEIQRLRDIAEDPDAQEAAESLAQIRKILGK